MLARRQPSVDLAEFSQKEGADFSKYSASDLQELMKKCYRRCKQQPSKFSFKTKASVQRHPKRPEPVRTNPDRHDVPPTPKGRLVAIRKPM
jgi:hypothetical protein